VIYLLDTNACIDVIRAASPQLVSRLQQHSPDEIVMSSVVRSELVYGARRSSRVAENLQLVDTFVAPYVSIPFDDQCADAYGHIRADLDGSGLPIGPYDLMIAATAKAHDLTVVTHNMGEFSRVVGLRVEDWRSTGT